MSSYCYRDKILEALKKAGFEVARNARHGTIYKHPSGLRLNVPYKLDDKNLTKRRLRAVGLELT